ncbi:molybdopterin oxidoreductase family protein [Solirubrobacter ginsenosidimutans]|uniref:Molybdopterin oxidoreductase family protein n=1 Tax=Solirubrobacter ginsenosidimutans TaxID=490573 RepID=A0A9X3MUT7_9ACTN|nr:molybdopterin oxidoreductase family protein [Solirubrobacter ginsenosidimutans]MDA0160223.1 molybdopterin oxidoreductase family protein [Solirubrobacter ginsenosidimutans]
MHEVLGACPLDCPDGCSWVVTVDDDGEAINLKGNRAHPFTAGALCAKVNGYLEHTKAPDRLLYPLKRVGAKGEGRFERISWDEALTTIAAKLQYVKDTYGGEAIWPFQGTGTLGYVQGLEGRAGQRLWNVLGASRHDMTACSVAGRQGATYVTGTAAGMDPETFAESKLILLWGTNTLTSGHHLWKFILKARKRGAHIVAIDPIRTRTAAQADEHLAPLPGTDAALALGLLNVIVSMGAEDRDYLDSNTVGWPEFKERILAFPPSKAAEITGIDEATIVALGERIATTRPTGIRCTMGMQRHAGGGNAMRLLYALPGVTGDWQYPGGGASYSTSGRFMPDLVSTYRDDLLQQPVRTLSMTQLGHTLLRADDPPVKALVIYGANPMSSNPDQHRVREGLQREDLFTVVIEQFPTDTVDYADIVLPATMQTEHLDVNDGYGHMYIHLNRPATAPPGECLSGTETFRRLAKAMGLEEPSLYDDDETLARTLLGDADFERLYETGWMRLDYQTPYVPFTEGFPTPSGKLEFYSESARDAGHDPLPGYVAPVRAETDDAHPLALIAPASHWFLNSMFANKPDLMKKAGGPRIELHPDDARARGLQTGDTATVFNARGSFEAAVEISDRVRPGVIASTKGYWLKHIRGGANVNATVEERDADMAGGAIFHDNRVEVERVRVADDDPGRLGQAEPVVASR